MCVFPLPRFVLDPFYAPPVLLPRRAAKEGALPADCAEEECDADEIQQQTGMFESYMASRYVCMYVSYVPTYGM